MSNKNLEQRLKKIEDRNERVEKDKKWETSLLRRVVITLLTYSIVFIYLRLTNVHNPALAAVVPALGFFLSTLVMKKIKQWWSTR